MHYVIATIGGANFVCEKMASSSGQRVPSSSHHEKLSAGTATSTTTRSSTSERNQGTHGRFTTPKTGDTRVSSTTTSSSLSVATSVSKDVRSQGHPKTGPVPGTRSGGAAGLAEDQTKVKVPPSDPSSRRGGVSVHNPVPRHVPRRAHFLSSRPAISSSSSQAAKQSKSLPRPLGGSTHLPPPSPIGNLQPVPSSPSYTSGNISSGNLSSGNLSSGEVNQIPL